MLCELFRHTYTCICDTIPYHHVPVIFAWMIAGVKFDTASVLCKFYRITQYIHQHLPDTHSISKHIRCFGYRQICTEFDTSVVQEALHDAEHCICNCPDIHRNRYEFDFAAFDTADIQHIIDQGQQMFGAITDFVETVPHLRFRLLFQCNIGKTDDGIHRGTNVMGHIVQESGFCTICILCGMDCILKFLIDFFILRPVRQIQNVFLLSLNVSAEYNHTKPQLLTGLLMDILSVPFTLLTGQNFRQLIQNVNRFIHPDQMLKLMDIIKNILFRNTCQFLNVGTDIFHSKIFCIHHQENIVHIDRQLGEQLVTGK